MGRTSHSEALLELFRGNFYCTSDQIPHLMTHRIEVIRGFGLLASRVPGLSVSRFLSLRRLMFVRLCMRNAQHGTETSFVECDFIIIIDLNGASNAPAIARRC